MNQKRVWSKSSKKYRQKSKKIGQSSKFIGRKEALLKFFYEHPQIKSTVRRLATQTKIKRSTVQYYLKLLKKEGFISKDNKWIDTWQNRLKKSYFYVEKIAESGLIDYLEEELAASAIILFGSFRKGESVKGSDIDIFIECAKEKEVNLKKFERLLGHKIHLVTQTKITKLPPHLLNNVVNGIKIKGYFKIK